jgi:Peptidase family M50
VVIAIGLFTALIGGALINPLGLTMAEPGVIQAFASRLMVANVVLAVFNLLPAFPMDGGRVLRAVLAIGMPRVQATAAAVGVGSVVAAAFLLLGLFTGHFGLVAVAIVVYLLGQAELAQVRAQAAARQWNERVDQWFSGPAGGAPPVARGYTGMVWDETRGLWVQYENGNVVRVIDPASQGGE